MPRRYDRDDDVAGIALTAAAGFATGLVIGMIAGEWIGEAPAQRLKDLARQLRGGAAPGLEPVALEAAVREALRRSATTRPLRITVRAPGAGLVELTGTVPTAVARRAAGDVARGVPGSDAVVNRLLVDGEDLPPQSLTSG